jgi:hypothetical protein
MRLALAATVALAEGDRGEQAISTGALAVAELIGTYQRR